MPIADFIPLLQDRLQTPLPGLNAQMIMAPPIRGKTVEVPQNAKQSAVMLLLYPHQDKWWIPFIRRAADGRVHAGQISLPGGRKDQTDPDFTFTALRETHEEIGIPPEQITVMGKLTEIYIPPSNSLVYPRIGLAQSRPDFEPNPSEVQDIIEVEITQFLDPNRRNIHEVDVFGGNFIQAPGYTVNEQDLIWGGTAMMVAEFAQLVAELQAAHAS